MAIQVLRLAYACSLIAAGAVSAPLLASSAGSAVQSQPTTSIEVPRAGNPNRQICTTDRMTGSRFPRRVCRTAAERDAARADQQDNLREYQHHGASTPADGGNGFGTNPNPAPTPQ